MKIINYVTILFISLLVVSCSKITEPVKKMGLGSRVVNYQADEKVSSLIIPPDLTAPSSQGAFTEVIEVNNDDNIAQKVQNVTRFPQKKYLHRLALQPKRRKE